MIGTSNHDLNAGVPSIVCLSALTSFSTCSTALKFNAVSNKAVAYLPVRLGIARLGLYIIKKIRIELIDLLMIVPLSHLESLVIQTLQVVL